MRIMQIRSKPLFELPYLMISDNRAVMTTSLPVLAATADTMPMGLDALVACADLQGTDFSKDSRAL